jgi:sugar phosphate isomerase/epimerase
VIRSCVTISLVPQARGGPFVFWDDLAAGCSQAAELGFDAVEIFPPGAEALDSAQVKRLLGDHHLQLAAMGTGAGWLIHKLTLTSPAAEERARAQAFVRSIIDLAGPLGAPAIIGSMQGRWGDGVDRAAALAYLAEGLSALGEHARQYGVPLLYEPLNRYETNLINRQADGAEWLQALSSDNVKLLADLFHMNIEEADLPAALKAAGRHIGHLHFVDSNRRPAGCGHLDFAPIGRALREIGYQGFASAEALPYPDSATAARLTIEAYRKFLLGD